MIDSPDVSAGTAEVSVNAAADSAFPQESGWNSPKHFVLSFDTPPEPRTNVEERWGVAGPEGAGTGAHLELLPLFAKWHKDASDDRTHKQSGNLENPPTTERYHWKGLLLQSFAFISIETTYRLFTDSYMRELTATAPYWRDYGISMQHWDMNRWSDGDDFLVDDIGHPMQGAVAGFIEIQNNPRDRDLRIGTSSAYWKSRFVAMMWATVYSTQQKIGPMGEAALGSAGGYTYPLHCPFPCTTPGVEYTNNTGWTDFIITPVVGTLWIVGEDFVDRFISDRVQGDSTRLFPKIFRGAMNPSRTMANALRWKNPWYRDYEHPRNPESGGVHFESDNDVIAKTLPRYEFFPHFNAFSLPVNTAQCTNCRSWTYGSGLGFSTRLTRWVDFDSDVDYQPNASPLPSDRAGGNAIVGTFGLRAGWTTPNYSFKASIRPGFVSYDSAYLTMPSATNATPEIGRITHFATALAINGDYGITRHLAVRGVFGNTPVRYLYTYLQPPGIGYPPYVNWLSHEVFMTQENWTYQMGPVLKF